MSEGKKIIVVTGASQGLSGTQCTPAGWRAYEILHVDGGRNVGS